MTRQEIEERLNECYSGIKTLESKLEKTDYIGVKIAEGAATKTEYASIRAERQGWRDEINTLEAEVEQLLAAEPDDEEPEIAEE